MIEPGNRELQCRLLHRGGFEGDCHLGDNGSAKALGSQRLVIKVEEPATGGAA